MIVVLNRAKLVQQAKMNTVIGRMFDYTKPRKPVPNFYSQFMSPLTRLGLTPIRLTASCQEIALIIGADSDNVLPPSYGRMRAMRRCWRLAWDRCQRGSLTGTSA